MLKRSIWALTGAAVVFAIIIIGSSIYTLYSKKEINIDPRLHEISGIEIDKKHHLWAINDGGDQAKLYQINQDGSIAREILVTNAKNIDWEDMTQNAFGHFFLGDFGNNDNDRRWLTIYKIENPIDIKGNTTEAEIIKFTYPMLGNNPVAPSDRNYDLEAFVEFGHDLYLFTKNRTEPFDGITNVYRVGTHAANFNAQLVGSFKTCTTLDKLCWITSAALSPDRTKLALLDSTSIWLFENFDDDDFFVSDVSRIDLGIVTQKEAITFLDDNTIVFTDEAFKGIGGNAYVIKLDEVNKTFIQNKDGSTTTAAPKMIKGRKPQTDDTLSLY
jgi:hypothetical protein